MRVISFFLSLNWVTLSRVSFSGNISKYSYVSVHENSKVTCFWNSLMKKNLIPQGMVHGWLLLNRQDAEGYFTSATRQAEEVVGVQPGEEKDAWRSQSTFL